MIIMHKIESKKVVAIIIPIRKSILISDVFADKFYNVFG